MILPRYPKRGEYIFYIQRFKNGKSMAICKVLCRDKDDVIFDEKQNCRSYKIESIADLHPNREDPWKGINVWIRTGKDVECEISKDLEHLLERYFMEAL